MKNENRKDVLLIKDMLLAIENIYEFTNNITIENLTPGIYSLRVFVPATGEQVVEKIVVNKR